MRRTHYLSRAIAVVVVLMAPLHAQAPASGASIRTFEVASIKVDRSGAKTATIAVQPGRYAAAAVTLRELVLNAYHLQGFQLSSGPAWISSDRFDLLAKMPSGLTQDEIADQLPRMLSGLLADRFKLTTHTESREGPIYALVAARSDEKLGPQMRRATTDCEPFAGDSTLKEKDSKGKSKVVQGVASPTGKVPGQRPACTMVVEPGRLASSGITMSVLAASLSSTVERTVADRTGLDGAFDVRLTWTPDRIAQGSTGGKNKRAQIDPNGPSIFTAVQEQLGLRLESARGPVDVLVIDHVEHPTGD
jgi:uncharacterized protein (TIGR03435 family)